MKTSLKTSLIYGLVLIGSALLTVGASHASPAGPPDSIINPANIEAALKNGGGVHATETIGPVDKADKQAKSSGPNGVATGDGNKLGIDGSAPSTSLDGSTANGGSTQGTASNFEVKMPQLDWITLGLSLGALGSFGLAVWFATRKPPEIHSAITYAAIGAGLAATAWIHPLIFVVGIGAVGFLAWPHIKAILAKTNLAATADAAKADAAKYLESTRAYVGMMDHPDVTTKLPATATKDETLAALKGAFIKESTPSDRQTVAEVAAADAGLAHAV